MVDVLFRFINDMTNVKQAYLYYLRYCLVFLMPYFYHSTAVLLCSYLLFDQVVLGGGQEAMDVTTTSTKIGKFDARFYDLVFEEEFGRVKGHFGPINSLAFHPDGEG